MPHSPLTRTYALEAGPSVHLRLARRREAAGVRTLLASRSLSADDLETKRLLTYDPAARAVVCAFALLDGVETLVGLGAIDLPGEEPDTLVTDEERAPGLARLMGELLMARAALHGRRVA
jgi:hypothetical protein